MSKFKLIILFLLGSSLWMRAQERMDEMWGDSKANISGSTKDYRLLTDGKYGMFIHFGMFSEISNRYKDKTYYGVGEWLMHKKMANIPVEEYKSMASRFNPVDFDATNIARIAKEAGMRYVVITSKHHDGFAMYNSRVGDFDIFKKTSFKRDILKELSDACRKEGLGFGFYYSHNQDWTYPGGRLAPSVNEKGEKKSFDDYLREKCLPQIEELTTQYGKIDIMWFDTPGGMTEEQVEKVVAIVRKNQPNALISGRVGKGKGDYLTLGDMEIPQRNVSGMWESPDTSNDAWAYAWYDENWKTPKDILQRLITCVARGGAYLPNIGPNGRGKIPERNVRVLKSVGKWLTCYPQAIYGVDASPYGHSLPWGEVTMNGSKMYLSVYKWPHDGKLYLFGLKTPVKTACILGKDLKTVWVSDKNMNGWQTIDVPIATPDELVSVIELELEGKAEVENRLWPVMPNEETRLLSNWAEVVNADKEERSWSEKFGEWKKTTHITNWMSNGRAYWDIVVQKPGDYMTHLEYRGEGRLVWEISVEGGEKVRNQQGSSDYYQELPIGWIHFPKAGKYRLSVSCLEGNLQKACLRAIKISPIIGI